MKPTNKMSDHSDNHHEPLKKPEVWLKKISKHPTIQRYASTAKSVLKFFIWGVVEDEDDPQLDISSIRATNKTSRKIVSTQPYRSSYHTEVDSQGNPRIQPIKTAARPEKEANQGDAGSQQHTDKDRLPPHTAGMLLTSMMKDTQ